MSDFKINSITTKQGQHGPVIAGVSTINSTGCMKIPSGPTYYRGNRGRGIFASGYTPNNLKAIDAINIASTGNATGWGEVITTGMAFAGGASNNFRGVYVGGFDGNNLGNRFNTIQALNIPTDGEIFDFGDLTYTAQQLSGVGNQTRGIFTNGYAIPLAPSTDALDMTYDMVEFMSTGGHTEFGDIIGNASTRDCATVETHIRGYFAGGEGTGQAPSTQNKNITIKGFANNSESLNFGELSQQSKRGSGVGSHTRGVFILGSLASPETFTNVIEFITLTTTGETTDFGDATANTGQSNNNSASNTIRGVYHHPRTSDGGTNLNTLEFITIATTGNATDFGDLNNAANSGCGLSDSHGGLPL
jgi:hypothetical protein